MFTRVDVSAEIMGKKKPKIDDDVKMSNPLFDVDPTDFEDPTADKSSAKSPKMPRLSSGGRSSDSGQSSGAPSPGKKPKMTKDGKAVVMMDNGGQSIAYAKNVPEFNPDHGQSARKIFIIMGTGIGGCK